MKIDRYCQRQRVTVYTLNELFNSMFPALICSRYLRYSAFIQALMRVCVS